MSLSLDQYLRKLINKILFADSQEEVIGYCDTALKGFGDPKINDRIIGLFLDRIIIELDLFNRTSKDGQQGSNITIAKIHFQRIKKRISTTAN
jgi:hypothetical protein